MAGRTSITGWLSYLSWCQLPNPRLYGLVALSFTFQSMIHNQQDTDISSRYEYTPLAAWNGWHHTLKRSWASITFPYQELCWNRT